MPGPGRTKTHPARGPQCRRPSGVKGFMASLYNALNSDDPAVQNIIQWSTDGDSFTISDVRRLEDELLSHENRRREGKPIIFWLNNFNSLRSRLNAYGFSVLQLSGGENASFICTHSRITQAWSKEDFEGYRVRDEVKLESKVDLSIPEPGLLPATGLDTILSLVEDSPKAFQHAASDSKSTDHVPSPSLFPFATGIASSTSSSASSDSDSASSSECDSDSDMDSDGDYKPGPYVPRTAASRRLTRADAVAPSPVITQTFLEQLFDISNNPANKDIIQWNTRGTRICLFDQNQLPHLWREHFGTFLGFYSKLDASGEHGFKMKPMRWKGPNWGSNSSIFLAYEHPILKRGVIAELTALTPGAGTAGALV
uniref:Heat shock transcriptional factor putative n=1 Tax=Mycena chlorophos TaxID=658473 RepID=A0ABQ0LLD2_MYCCL|nr:heat shock transcriptional factor putative [Mycena chlorophos]